MPELNITINKTNYQLNCDEGQEQQLQDMAQKLNDRVSTLAQALPHATQSWLLVTTGILLLDEIKDLNHKLQDEKENQQHVIYDDFLHQIDKRLDNIITLLAAEDDNITENKPTI